MQSLQSICTCALARQSLAHNDQSQWVPLVLYIMPETDGHWGATGNRFLEFEFFAATYEAFV